MSRPAYQRSEAAKSYRKLYLTTQWRETRHRQLLAQPHCAYCLARGVITKATVCNHVERHNGDPAKFWRGPFNSLCADCHDVDQQRIERGGKPRQIVDEDGWPRDL